MKPTLKPNLEANKDIILTLIEADLKHNQLLGNLRKMELHTDEYILKLYEAIAELMGLGKEPGQEWFDIYDSFLLNAHEHAISEEADHWQSMAEDCYELLCASVKVKGYLSSVT